jgi:DNA-binding CsgD family transcriptional regulator
MLLNSEATTPPAGSLAAFLSGPVIRNDDALSTLLIQANSLPDTPLIIFDFLRQATVHIADTMFGISGYTAGECCAGGSDFVFQLTNPADIPSLMLLQAGYIQEAKASNFNPCSFRFQDYYWSILHKNGTKVPVVSTGLMLTYTAHYDFHIGVAFHVPSDRDFDGKVLQCKDLLRRIKQRHNQVYRHYSLNGATGPYPIHHVNKAADSITQRERQVLAMVAEGHSTDAIAGSLSIASNTVESHRKKLLQKFEAKNSAELIKKASKIFWL